MGNLFYFPDKMMKEPTVIFEPKITGKPVVVWQLERPSPIWRPHCWDLIDFIDRYLEYFRGLPLENLCDDDVGFRLFTRWYNNSPNHLERIQEYMTSYGIVSTILRTNKLAEDRELWTTLNENCDDVAWRYVESGLGKFNEDKFEDGELFSGLRLLKKYFLKNFVQFTRFHMFKDGIASRAPDITQLLEQIYREFQQDIKKREVDSKIKWENWTQTPIQNWKTSYLLFNWLRKHLFVDFHLNFFKRRTIETIMNYEIGARLFLHFSKNTTLEEGKFHKSLLVCITTKNLIRNIQKKCLFDEFFNDFKRVNVEIWDKYSEELITLKQNDQFIVLERFLNSIYHDEIKYLKTLPETIWILKSILNGDEVTKLYLHLIYLEFREDLRI